MILRYVLILGLALIVSPAFGQDQYGSEDSVQAVELLPKIYVTQDRGGQDPGLQLSVSDEDLLLLTPDHPAEALNALPGVNTQMNSGQEHLIALRSPVLTGGAGQGSFLILENGLPTRSSAFGNVNGLFEPLHELASNVEVVVGPGSAKYGSNAVHGLINVGLPNPTEAQPDLNVSASSLGRQKAGALFTIGDQSVVGFAVQNDTGWRDNTGIGQQKLYLAQGFNFGRWDGLAWISASNLNQETAGFIEGTKAYRDRSLAKTNPNPEAYRDAKSARAAIQFVRPGDIVSWRITPYVRWQEMEFRQHFLPYKGIEENGHDAFGVQTRADWTYAENVTLRFGADADFANGYLIERQDDPFGFFPGDPRFPVGIHYDYNVDTSVYATWSELAWQASEQLSVLAGVRAETHEYSYTSAAPAGINGRFNVPSDRSDNFDFVTPKLGVVYDVARQHSLFANLARGARAPQASDLYRLQSQQVAGEVDVETLDSVEIGARGTIGDAGRAQYQIAAYRAEKDNFFFRDSDGLNVTDGTTEHLGVDMQFRLEMVSDKVAMTAAVSWADHTYTFDRFANGIRDGNQVDTAPEWLADFAIDWHAAPKIKLRGELEYIGEYFTDPANSRAYPGHVVFHAAGHYALSDTVEAFTRIRNLFDLNYADRADFAFGNERYFPGEPLNITFGIRKSFGQ